VVYFAAVPFSGDIGNAAVDSLIFCNHLVGNGRTRGGHSIILDQVKAEMGERGEDIDFGEPTGPGGEMFVNMTFPSQAIREEFSLKSIGKMAGDAGRALKGGKPSNAVPDQDRPREYAKAVETVSDYLKLFRSCRQTWLAPKQSICFQLVVDECNQLGVLAIFASDNVDLRKPPAHGAPWPQRSTFAEVILRRRETAGTANAADVLSYCLSSSANAPRNFRLSHKVAEVDALNFAPDVRFPNIVNCAEDCFLQRLSLAAEVDVELAILNAQRRVVAAGHKQSIFDIARKLADTANDQRELEFTRTIFLFLLAHISSSLLFR
jgi:hypothetical protein